MALPPLPVAAGNFLELLLWSLSLHYVGLLFARGVVSSNTKIGNDCEGIYYTASKAYTLTLPIFAIAGASDGWVSIKRF